MWTVFLLPNPLPISLNTAFPHRYIQYTRPSKLHCSMYGCNCSTQPLWSLPAIWTFEFPFEFPQLPISSKQFHKHAHKVLQLLSTFWWEMWVLSQGIHWSVHWKNTIWSQHINRKYRSSFFRFHRHIL